jgi:hypothetical protein
LNDDARTKKDTFAENQQKWLNLSLDLEESLLHKQLSAIHAKNTENALLSYIEDINNIMIVLGLEPTNLSTLKDQLDKKSTAFETD